MVFTPLPPAEKLPLALRKNIRDEWENKKSEMETQISEALGGDWKFDINPNALFPYATDDWAKQSLGSCIANYAQTATGNLKSFADEFGDEGKKEINEIVHTHTITIAPEDYKKPRIYYCGTDVKDGVLRIVFAEGKLGTNTHYAIQKSDLEKALNEAEPAAASAAASGGARPMSYSARTSVRNDWPKHENDVKEKVAEQLGKSEDDIKLRPDFEDVYAKLKVEAGRKNTNLQENWESRLGETMGSYFAALASTLKEKGFEDDEMLKEGFVDAVPNCEVAFRIVDKLKYDSYCECVVENEVLYLQTLAEKFGTNVYYVAQKVVDQL